jgi:hypothetical protein
MSPYPPPNSDVKIWMYLETGSFKKVVKIKWGYWDRTQFSMTDALKKSKHKTHTKERPREHKPRREAFRRNQPCQHLDLGFLTSRTEEMYLCYLNHPVCGTLWYNFSKLIQMSLWNKLNPLHKFINLSLGHLNIKEINTLVHSAWDILCPEHYAFIQNLHHIS